MNNKKNRLINLKRRLSHFNWIKEQLIANDDKEYWIEKEWFEEIKIMNISAIRCEINAIEDAIELNLK